MALSISSPAFQNQEKIPPKYTCDGADESPPLQWEGVPEGTKSFALIMDDPDAPPGTWVHWVTYNIPGDATGLPENFPKVENHQDGTRQGLCWGVDDFDRVGYYGPCPPPGHDHRYFFKLYALDIPLELPGKATKADVEKAMKEHILGETQLIGKYGR